MSEAVERRMLALLDYPTRCPHGNVIPGLAELGLPAEASARVFAAEHAPVQAMTEVVLPRGEPVIVQRISEQVQSDADLMLKLKRVGIQPGREVTLVASDGGVRVRGAAAAGAPSAELPRWIAAHVFVTRP